LSKVFLFCILFVFPYVFCKVEKGNIRGSSTNDDWIFVSKFCFSKGMGNLTWTGYSTDSRKLLLLFYDDEQTSWPSIYPRSDSLTCEQKVSMAIANRSVVSGLQIIQPFEDDARPHYWYIAISNCGETSKLEFEYDFQFINVGGPWERQFSYDDQGLIEMYLIFWILFTLVTIVHLRGVWTLFSTKSFHPIVKLLTTTLLLETFSLLCLFIHYVIYASNGIGANGLKGLGEILDMGTQLVFMFLLILIAKGWCITRTTITGQKLLLVVGSLFLIGYVSMFTWENVGRDRASSLYIYESVPGILLLVLRVITFGWFLWELRQTFIEEEDPKKRTFYKYFGGAYSCWFLALVLVVITAIISPAWDRAKTVMALYLIFNCLGFCSLAFILWPSRAIYYFQIIKKDDLLLGNTFHNTPYDTL